MGDLVPLGFLFFTVCTYIWDEFVYELGVKITEGSHQE